MPLTVASNVQGGLQLSGLQILRLTPSQLLRSVGHVVGVGTYPRGVDERALAFDRRDTPM